MWEGRIREMNQQVWSLHSEGRDVEAAELGRQVLELSRRHLGEAQPGTAKSYENLGMVLGALRDLAGGCRHLKHALAIFRQILPGDHLQLAACHGNLGLLLREFGDFAGSQQHIQAALNIFLGTLPANHPHVASSHGNLGLVLLDLGDLAGSRRHLEKALDTFQRILPDDHPELAGCHNNLGLVLMELGDLPSARSHFQMALEISQHSLPDDHRKLAGRHSNLGWVLQDLGELASARHHTEMALDIFERTLAADHPELATGHNNLGTLLQDMGDLAGARVHLEKALEIRQRILPADHPQLAQSHNNLGALLQAFGDLSAARRHKEQALEIRRSSLPADHPHLASSHNNLGTLLEELGDLAAARHHKEQALEINQRSLPAEHPDLAINHNNLGTLLHELGDLSGARCHHKQALDIRQHILPADHPDLATSHNNLGTLLRDLGEFSGARVHLQKAMEIQQRSLPEAHPDLATTYSNLGTLEVASGRINEAVALKHQASAIDDRMIGQVFSIGSDQQRLLFLRKLQGRQEEFLSLVYRHLSHSPKAMRTALELVLRRKALGAEALASQRDAILGGRYPHLREAFDQLNQLRKRTAQKMLAGPAPGETLAAHEQTLHERQQEQQQRETALVRQIPEMSLEQQLQKADRRAVALALPENVTLVEFVRFNVFDFNAILARRERKWQPARYLAFVLHAGQPENVQMIDLGEAEPIDRLIADFRATITGESEHDTNRDMVKAKSLPVPSDEDRSGRALRTAVFDPLVAAFSDRKRLFLAPDGDLSRLPFEVLPTDDGRRLIDDYCISYVSCGRDVLRFQAQSTGQPSEALVVADPDFDLRDDGKATSRQPDVTAGRQSRDLGETDLSFDRLLGTREEGERIAKLLKVRPWLQAEVLERRLKQVRSPWILHLATHGFFLADQGREPDQHAWIGGSDMGRFAGLRLENPLLRSGLALAGGNTWLRKGQLPPEAEDGLLTAEDVTGMDLLDTELVVLSACDTGLGEIRTGEGVFGLRRAFVLAGAKTLVMSLWKVPDEETRELMEDFYRRILAGEPRAEALRNAQLAMKAKYPDPFFWGAFICQGNPDPLPPRRRWYYSLDGKKAHGPVSDAELRELVRTGELTRTAKVSLDRKTWQEASQLKGIKWPSS